MAVEVSERQSYARLAKNPQDSRVIDARVICAACGVTSQRSLKIGHAAERRDFGTDYYCVAGCPNPDCGAGTFLIIHDLYNDLVNNRIGDWLETSTFPSRDVKFDADGVPDEVAAEFSEALSCFHDGHFIAAMLVGRRVLQVAVRSVVGKLDTLEKEIEAVPDDKLSKQLKAQATHIRWGGNDAAHADPVDADDVDLMLDYVGQILEALYTRPAELARLNEKREAKKKAVAEAKAAAKAKAEAEADGK